MARPKPPKPAADLNDPAVKHAETLPVAAKRPSRELAIVYLPTEQLDVHPLNANEQAPETFNALVTAIKEGGTCDEPVHVVKRGDRYLCVAGNHRMLACRVAGLSTVPCIVHDWTDAEVLLELLRRNSIKGNVNPVKLTRIVNSMGPMTPTKIQELRLRLGFTEKDWGKVFRDRKSGASQSVIDKLKAASPGVKMAGNLTMVISKILTEFGDTVDRGFVFFMFGGRMHLMVQVDKDHADRLDALQKWCRAQKKDVAELLLEYLTTFDRKEK